MMGTERNPLDWKFASEQMRRYPRRPEPKYGIAALTLSVIVTSGMFLAVMLAW